MAIQPYDPRRDGTPQRPLEIAPDDGGGCARTAALFILLEFLTALGVFLYFVYK